jgi:8-oxo-dGTP diphosphatase
LIRSYPRAGFDLGLEIIIEKLNSKWRIAVPENKLVCPKCKATVTTYRNPFPTVDIIIRVDGKIVLIERKNEPKGWALPGGFVDYGESLEAAATREAAEETGLELKDLRQFGAYSDPGRDPRQHNISFVFTAEGQGEPRGGDDAATALLFSLDELPSPLCFDHAKILADYRRSLQKTSETKL